MTGAASYWTAVILAGGRGHRLGDVEKARLPLHGRSLLDHLLLQLPTQVPVIVVGPEVQTLRPVTFVVEQPRYGGPVAGLAAALPLVTTPSFALLATDMPRAGAVILELIGLLNDEDEVLMPLDASGHRQQLCSALRTEAARSAIRQLATTTDVSMRDFMALLRVREWQLTPEQSLLLQDVDTPEDLQRLEAER